MKSREHIEKLRADIAKAKEMLEAGHRDGARKALREVEASNPTGIESAFVLFWLAETYRRSESVACTEAGFALCCRVVQLDPIHPAHQQQFAEFGDKMRRRLDFHSRFAAQPHAPRLYATLQRTGEANGASHVFMARWLASNERFDEAMKLLSATVMLEPARADAWALMADVADKTGNEAEAGRCRARVAELNEAAAPFGVPSPTAMC